MFQALLQVRRNMGEEEIYRKLTTHPQIANVETTRRQRIIATFKPTFKRSKKSKIQIFNPPLRVQLTYKSGRELLDLKQVLKEIFGSHIYYLQVHPYHWLLRMLSSPRGTMITLMLFAAVFSPFTLIGLRDSALIQIFWLSLLLGVGMFVYKYNRKQKKKSSNFKSWLLLVTTIIWIAGATRVFEADVTFRWVAICGAGFLIEELLEMLLTPSKFLHWLGLTRA